MDDNIARSSSVTTTPATLKFFMGAPKKSAGAPNGNVAPLARSPPLNYGGLRLSGFESLGARNVQNSEFRVTRAHGGLKSSAEVKFLNINLSTSVKFNVPTSKKISPYFFETGIRDSS